jgi:hypothetical protein
MNLSRIYIPVVALIICLVTRWIFVVGYGDFGTDYDYVSRLFQGQWQGLDFFAVFPPLSGYSLLLFSELFSQKYLTINIHLWFWWGLNFITAAMIMHAYNGAKELTALVAVTVALLTIPTNMHGASFAYIASTLCGLSVFCMLTYLRTGYVAIAILAGLLGGIAIVSKPNVGLAIVGAITFTCFGAGIIQRLFRKRYFSCFLLFLIGALCGAFVAIAIPGWYGGYWELAREVFLGGSEIKGGGVWLLLRAIPRISLTIEPPMRWVAEFSLSASLFVLISVIFVRLSRISNKAENTESPKSLNFAEMYLWMLFIAVLVLSLWSLWPKEFPWRLVTIFNDWGFTSLPFFLWQLLYQMVFVSLMVAIVTGCARKEFLLGIRTPFWASIGCLVWTLGICASGRHNIVFAANLFVPVIVHKYAIGREKEFYKLVLGLLFVWTFAWHVAPNWKSTFSQLTPLPDDSKFAGMYWPEGGAQTPGAYPVWNSSKTIIELAKNISPRVENKSVLWLIPGPGAAFGGNIYRYGIHGLSSNNVPLRGEKIFGDGVRSDPPDFIVSSNLDEWEDHKWSFMRPDIIEPWLHENYNLVWRLNNNSAPIYLWEKKAGGKVLP